MTPDEKVAELLTLNADKAQNDSWLLPVDLEQRIAQAIREAKIEAYEEAARIVEQANITSGIRPKFPIRGGGLYTAIRTQVGHSKAQLAASIRALNDSLVETVPSR